MSIGWLASAAARIPLPEKNISIDISCINKTLEHIQNSIISNTIHSIQQASTAHY